MNNEKTIKTATKIMDNLFKAATSKRNSPYERTCHRENAVDINELLAFALQGTPWAIERLEMINRSYGY